MNSEICVQQATHRNANMPFFIDMSHFITIGGGGEKVTFKEKSCHRKQKQLKQFPLEVAALGPGSNLSKFVKPGWHSH